MNIYTKTFQTPFNGRFNLYSWWWELQQGTRNIKYRYDSIHRYDRTCSSIGALHSTIHLMKNSVILFLFSPLLSNHIFVTVIHCVHITSLLRFYFYSVLYLWYDYCPYYFPFHIKNILHLLMPCFCSCSFDVPCHSSSFYLLRCIVKFLKVSDFNFSKSQKGWEYHDTSSSDTL